MPRKKKKSNLKPKPDSLDEDLVDEDIDSEFPKAFGGVAGQGVQFDLYMIRATRRDTSEDEPTYVMARHEEEAVCLWHALNAADHEEACELTVTRIQNWGEAHER